MLLLTTLFMIFDLGFYKSCTAGRHADRLTDVICEYCYEYISFCVCIYSMNWCGWHNDFVMHHLLISWFLNNSQELVLINDFLYPNSYRLQAFNVCTALSETLLSWDISSRREATNYWISTTFYSARLWYSFV